MKKKKDCQSVNEIKSGFENFSFPGSIRVRRRRLVGERRRRIWSDNQRPEQQQRVLRPGNAQSPPVRHGALYLVEACEQL